MKASILIFSQTGNTLKVGASVSKGLEICGVEIDQVSFLHRNRWKPDNADIIGIGCPVFENRPAVATLARGRQPSERGLHQIPSTPAWPSNLMIKISLNPHRATSFERILPLPVIPLRSSFS